MTSEETEVLKKAAYELWNWELVPNQTEHSVRFPIVLFRSLVALARSGGGAFTEIQIERQRQTDLWGGPDHDDEHVAADWFRLIEHQHQKFQHAVSNHAPHLDGQFARARLVKIAALAVAGIESIDRRPR